VGIQLTGGLGQDSRLLSIALGIVGSDVSPTGGSSRTSTL